MLRIYQKSECGGLLGVKWLSNFPKKKSLSHWLWKAWVIAFCVAGRGHWLLDVLIFKDPLVFSFMFQLHFGHTVKVPVPKPLRSPGGQATSPSLLLDFSQWAPCGSALCLAQFIHHFSTGFLPHRILLNHSSAYSPSLNSLPLLVSIFFSLLLSLHYDKDASIESRSFFFSFCYGLHFSIY